MADHIPPNRLVDQLVAQGWIRNVANPRIAYKRIVEVSVTVSMFQDDHELDVVFAWPSFINSGRFDHMTCSTIEAVDQAIQNVIIEWKEARRGYRR
jgi:hypothetical protein